LTTDECRRFAIANAPFADDLDQHSENDSPSHPKLQKKAVERAETSRLVRGHAADELRNRAAGEALEEFYKLAEAEGQFDLLSSAEMELRQQLESALKAEEAGLKDRADIPALRRRLLDLEAQQAKLEAGIGALNASLRARLGLPGNDTLPLSPTDPLRVKPDDVDIERAVVTGLQYRPDLNLLRVLSADGAGDLADAVLTGLNPLLGKLEPENLLRLMLAPVMRDPKRHQAGASDRAARALAARERQADAEIRAAGVMLRGHRAAIAARILDVKQLEAKIEELLIRQKAGLNVTAELTTAKLDLYKAKGDLLSAVIQWHITEVKLRQAMGLLVRSPE
jgi:outer membrane protein TolC